MSAAETPSSRAEALLALGAWRDLRGVAFAVLGLGRSGLAAAKALHQRGADVRVYDDRAGEQVEAIARRLPPGVTARLGSGYVARPEEICVVSPGIPPSAPTFRRAQASALRLIGEVELFYRLDRAANHGLGHPIVAISGTDGKTTTAMMIAHILESAGLKPCLAGNIGTPLCEVVDTLAPEQWIVAEVSAFQLATCDRFRPRVAVLTNVADDHHDWFSGDAGAYADAKRAVARRCGPGDTIVAKADDPAFARPLLERSGVRMVTFSAVDRGADLREVDDQLVCKVGSVDVPILRRASLGAAGGDPLPGAHNVANALAAAGAAMACGVSVQRAGDALRTFVAAPHRLQSVGTIGQVRFVDDSKATNPHAALAGLAAIDVGPGEQLVWIGGGSDKQADFTTLAAALGTREAHVVLIGQTADQIAAALPAGVRVQRCDSMHEAVSQAFTLAQPAGVVLLSPACASFGMFSSYSHRGQVFQEAVAALRRAVD